MLYVIRQANHPDLDYRGGQENIVHLELDLNKLVRWAGKKGLRWAFTLGNAGSMFFEDRNDLGQLGEINWNAVFATQWNNSDIKEGKQAEFLVENQVPWELVERIGVINKSIEAKVLKSISSAAHKPAVEIKPDWYY